MTVSKNDFLNGGNDPTGGEGSGGRASTGGDGSGGGRAHFCGDMGGGFTNTIKLSFESNK